MRLSGTRGIDARRELLVSWRSMPFALGSVPFVVWFILAWAVLIGVLLVLVRRDRAKDVRLLESMGLRGSWTTKSFCLVGTLGGMPVTVSSGKVRSGRRGVSLVTRIQIQAPPSGHVVLVQNRVYDSLDRTPSFGMVPVDAGHVGFQVHTGGDATSHAWRARGADPLSRLSGDAVKFLWEVGCAHGEVNVVFGTSNLHMVPEAFRRALELALTVARL
jgi:hypothetical protein